MVGSGNVLQEWFFRSPDALQNVRISRGKKPVRKKIDKSINKKNLCEK